MWIEQKVLSAGPQGTIQPGTVHEVPDREGADAVAGGYAVPASRPQPEAPETAEAPVKPQVETSEPPAGGKAKKKGRGFSGKV